MKEKNANKSLVDIARNTPPADWNKGRKVDRDELIELALAYANREITSSQALAAYREFMGPAKTISGGNHITRMGSVIVSAIRRGILKIERVKK